MTEEEKTELRELPAVMVAEWERHFPDLIIDEHVKLDEDSTTTHTTEAEILVFDLPREDLHKLHVARHAYEHLIGVAEDDDRLADLIPKARAICPPAVYFGQETPFRLQSDETQWFQWFGEEFFGLSKRSTHAFWHKHSFALSHLTYYGDDDISASG
jgi:hypothetical protein